MSESSSSTNTSPIHSKEPLPRRLLPKWSISKLSSIPIHKLSACVHASKHVPKPLPNALPRALTNPFVPPSSPRFGNRSSSADTTQNKSLQQQEDSLFLTMLPVEIRLHIYSLLLAPADRRLVHIIVKQNRLGHFRCRFTCDPSSSSSSSSQQTICDPEERRCLEGWLAYKASHLGGKGQDRRYVLKTDDGGEVSLLRTCKMVYAEAVGELYRLNRFHFSDVGDLGVFARGVVGGRLKDVTELMVDWDRDGLLLGDGQGKKIEKRRRVGREEWEEAWKIIGRMEGLRALRVVLKSSGGTEMARRERMEMGGLMMGLKELERFELVVPWDNQDGWESVEGSPWEVTRGVEPANTDTDN